MQVSLGGGAKMELGCELGSGRESAGDGAEGRPRPFRVEIQIKSSETDSSVRPRQSLDMAIPDVAIVDPAIADPTRTYGSSLVQNHLAAQIAIEPVTETHAPLARQAYRDLGKSSGHPAKLNFGDCFSYALAKSEGEPLLFKGQEFSRTEVKPARGEPTGQPSLRNHGRGREATRTPSTAFPNSRSRP